MKTTGTYEKVDIGGHAVKTKTTSNQVQRDPSASIRELIIAMTKAFKCAKQSAFQGLVVPV